MKLVTLFALGCLLISVTAYSQLSVVSTDPVNEAVNVPLVKVLSITFNAPLDTLHGLTVAKNLITNIDTVAGLWFSADKRTMYVEAHLSAGKPYFLCIVTMTDSTGSALPYPFGMYFTTAPVWSGVHVTGSIHAGTTGADVSHALVVLSTRPLADGDPIFYMGAVSDPSGNFDIPHVSNGTYYPIAAKDANGDGNIDPSTGDYLGWIDSIRVLSADLNGLSITFVRINPFSFTEAAHILDSVASVTLPPDAVLRYVSAWQIDSVAKSGEWEFYYTSASTSEGYEVRTQTFSTSVRTIDSMMYNWMKNLRPITDLAAAAPPDSFVVHTELSGGADFRHQMYADTLTMQVTLNLGQLSYGNYWNVAPAADSLYWGINYALGYEYPPNYWNTVMERKFVGDYYTGEILGTTGVRENTGGPLKFSLAQNWPNPFNPSTTISYSIGPEGSHPVFVSLKVYNILGMEIATLVNEVKTSGDYSVTWDASRYSSGIYFYKLEAGGNLGVKRMVLVK